MTGVSEYWLRNPYSAPSRYSRLTIAHLQVRERMLVVALKTCYFEDPMLHYVGEEMYACVRNVQTSKRLRYYILIVTCKNGAKLAIQYSNTYVYSTPIIIHLALT